MGNPPAFDHPTGTDLFRQNVLTDVDPRRLICRRRTNRSAGLDLFSIEDRPRGHDRIVADNGEVPEDAVDSDVRP